MGRRNDEDSLFWRSIRLHKVSIIRHALMRTEGNIAAAAGYLGISDGGLRKEIEKLEASGLAVRDVEAKTPPTAPLDDVQAVPTEEAPHMGQDEEPTDAPE